MWPWKREPPLFSCPEHRELARAEIMGEYMSESAPRHRKMVHLAGRVYAEGWDGLTVDEQSSLLCWVFWPNEEYWAYVKECGQELPEGK